MLIIVSKHYYQTHDKWPLIYPNATANPYTCIFNNHLPYFLYYCKLLTLNLTLALHTSHRLRFSGKTHNMILLQGFHKPAPFKKDNNFSMQKYSFGCGPV